ncbi:MAG TPA: response regulator transcription factor [Thermomicrobiales bacterium]|nr:response regulator transcription factor [Thermomicrobiales bacterium]
MREPHELIQVVIVDDHPLFRDGVVNTLSAQPDIEVVGEGASADDALRLAQAFLPDTILLDISMPGGGLQAVGKIAASVPVTSIVMLTASEHEEDVTAALKAGARGYIVKGVAARELVNIVRSIHVGEVYVTPSLAATLLFELTGAGSRSSAGGKLLDELTERERQILERVAAGDSNKEIGSALFISEKTVKHHMTNILQKLQVRNRVEAAMLTHRESRGD